MPYSHTHEESQWLASLWNAYGRSGKSTTIRKIGRASCRERV